MNPAAAALAGLDLPLPLAVAYSGGADSTVLLLAAAQRWPGQVHAIHVHHGLQPAADDFEAHCRLSCAALGVPLRVLRIDARPARGDSPEDAARRARYVALAGAALALGAKAVLLGQHADDQAETLLLALSAVEIRQWIAAQGMAVVHDPSNTDTALTRNRIRHLVLPALERAFPQFRETFARSARHAAQAQALLAEVAAQDLAATGSPPAIAALQALSQARQANLLRHWLRSVHDESPSEAQLTQLLSQVAACTTRGHDLHLKVGRGYVDRDGPRLQFTIP